MIVNDDITEKLHEENVWCCCPIGAVRKCKHPDYRHSSRMFI